MNGFRYHPDVIEQYPHVVAGVLMLRDVQNGPASDELKSIYEAEQKATLKRIGDTPLSELESLAAWRRTFSSFGVNPTQYRSAAESLLRRLTKKGDIPSINTLADIGNLVSIRYGLPVAVMDVRDVQGYITVRFAGGNEAFNALGEDGTSTPSQGEVIFADEQGLVLARRWCWRQAKEAASREDTTNALICVEAQHENSKNTIKSAQGDLIELVTRYAGGSVVAGVLDKWRSTIPRE